MQLQFTTLDVFSTTRYQGNPLAIISVPTTLSSSLTQSQKQAIASEFNLSEVVFLHLPEDASSKSRNIDIFTPHAEVPFAGHPTIGTSYYILNILKQDVNTLITKAGPISISRANFDSVKASIPFDFHVHTLTIPYATRASHAFPARGLPPTQHPVASIVNGMTFIDVKLHDLEDLAAVEDNLNEGGTYDPSKLDEGWQNGLVGTMYYVSQGTDPEGRQKYRTRMMVDGLEDPGTGSASAGLGCLLSQGKGGESKFILEQGVEMGRRNVIEVDVTRGWADEDRKIKDVVLGGAAVKVMEGVLEV